MWQKLKSYGLVSLITLLIWTWAERESLSTSTSDARIEVMADDKADLVARVVEPQWKGAVRVNLRGSNASIDAAQRVLAATVRLTPGIGSVPGTAGEHVIDLREALRDHPSLRRQGVTIAGVEPPSVRIVIEELVTRIVPLRLQAPGISLEGEPTFAVPTVELHLPAAAAARITEGTYAIAVVSTDVLSRLSDERPQVVQARVIPPESLVGVSPVTVVPDAVQATIKLRARRETMLLNEVPVVIAMPPGQAAQWNVEVVEPTMRNIVATGPREALAALRSGEMTVQAVVTLTNEDLNTRAERGTAIILAVPSGATSNTAAQNNLRFEAADLKVALRISPRGK